MSKHKAVYLLLLIQIVGCDRGAAERPGTEKSEVADTVANQQDVDELHKNTVTVTGARLLMNSEAIGVWQLSEYAALFDNKIVELQGDDAKPGAIEAWLYATTNDGISKLAPQTGLELIIRADGSFADRIIKDGLQLDWMDYAEGALSSSPISAEGTIKLISGRDGLFLHPRSIPSWMNESREMSAHRDALGYDDGDLIICDLVRPSGDSLLRVISIVVDGVYLNRIVARYERTRAMP